MKKHSVWLLFVLLFLASFDMHAQLPLLGPYAASMGAPAFFIGIIVGAYSSSNLIGNLVAGPFLDRYSKKMFISLGLLSSGVLLATHGLINEAKNLLLLRFMYGFFMAFVTPACFALLGQLGKTGEEQGKVMAKNGIGLTMASISAPLVSGSMATTYGYTTSFALYGSILLVAGLLAGLLLPFDRPRGGVAELRGVHSEQLPFWKSILIVLNQKEVWPAYVAGLVLMYAQGTIVYEVPLFISRQHFDPNITGRLFGCMGIGSLLVLSQFWLHRISPLFRVVTGLFSVSLIYYAIAMGYPISLYVLLMAKGACFGLLFPAMSTILTQAAPKGLYGSAFSLFSAVLSIGAMVSPAIAGALDDWSRSFFLSFVVLISGGLICMTFYNRTREYPISKRIT